VRLVRIGFFDSGIGKREVKAVVIVLIKRDQLSSDWISQTHFDCYKPHIHLSHKPL